MKRVQFEDDIYNFTVKTKLIKSYSKEQKCLSIKQKVNTYNFRHREATVIGQIPSIHSLDKGRANLNTCAKTCTQVSSQWPDDLKDFGHK